VQRTESRIHEGANIVHTCSAGRLQALNQAKEFSTIPITAMTSSKFAVTDCGGSLRSPLGLPLSRCSQFQSADPHLFRLRQTFHASLFQDKQRHASELRISCNFRHRRGLDVGVDVGQLYNGWYLEQAILIPPSLKYNGQSRVSNPARRRLEVARSSGRYAASVIRGSIGKRRIRRSKDVGADEDDVSDDDQVAISALFILRCQVHVAVSGPYSFVTNSAIPSALCCS
jgi:hypothetical protein